MKVAPNLYDAAHADADLLAIAEDAGPVATSMARAFLKHTPAERVAVLFWLSRVLVPSDRMHAASSRELASRLEQDTRLRISSAAIACAMMILDCAIADVVGEGEAQRVYFRCAPRFRRADLPASKRWTANLESIEHAPAAERDELRRLVALAGRPTLGVLDGGSR